MNRVKPSVNCGLSVREASGEREIDSVTVQFTRAVLSIVLIMASTETG